MGRDYFGTLKDPLEKNFSRKQPDNRVSPSLYGTDYQTVVCADTNVFNPAVLKQVTPPNNQSYQFKYNVFGEIEKIIYPTGGYERFRYDYVAPISITNYPYSQANRGVVERWVSPSGNGSEKSSNHWVYTTGTAPYRTIITAPNGARTERVIYGGGAGGGIGWTAYGYSDQPGNLFVLTRSALDSSRSTEATKYFDGLARAWRSAQSEGATSILADVQYDSMGRVWKTSNPYRAGETVVWTTTAYDSLSTKQRGVINQTKRGQA